jgi:hypothetical protein
MIQENRVVMNLAGPHKINSPVKFDTAMSMDRYLHSNKDATMRVREHVDRLRKDKANLVQELAGHTHYHKQIALDDALEATIRYAKSKNLSGMHDSPFFANVLQLDSLQSSRIATTKR